MINRRIPAFTNGAIHVQLEEIHAADAAAVIVATESIPAIAHRGAGAETAVPFVIETATAVDPSLEYRVRVWVDRESRGYEGPGDLYSDTAYPVLTRGAPSSARVLLG